VPAHGAVDTRRSPTGGRTQCGVAGDAPPIRTAGTGLPGQPPALIDVGLRHRTATVDHGLRCTPAEPHDRRQRDGEHEEAEPQPRLAVRRRWRQS
ncbi:MAG: hypothetical protein PVJ30_08960, partial [Thiohalocapsa sp.]